MEIESKKGELMKRSIIIFLGTLVSFGAQTKYYKGIKEPQNVLDMCILLDRTRSSGVSQEEKFAQKTMYAGVILKNLLETIEQKQAFIASAPLLRALAFLAEKHSRGKEPMIHKDDTLVRKNPKYIEAIKKICGKNWGLYRTRDRNFAIGIPKFWARPE